MGAPIPTIVRVDADKHVPRQPDSIPVSIQDAEKAGRFFDTAYELMGHGNFVTAPDLSVTPYYVAVLIDELGEPFVMMNVCLDRFVIEAGPDSSWEDDPEGKLWNTLEQGVNHG